MSVYLLLGFVLLHQHVDVLLEIGHLHGCGYRQKPLFSLKHQTGMESIEVCCCHSRGQDSLLVVRVG